MKNALCCPVYGNRAYIFPGKEGGCRTTKKEGGQWNRSRSPRGRKIGTEEVRRATDILRRYHAGKRQLEQRIIDNEQFWKLRHWQQMEKTGQGGNPADPQPTSGWLVNCILSKHADAMDCYPEPTVLPPGAREWEETRS